MSIIEKAAGKIGAAASNPQAAKPPVDNTRREATA
jgi:hypothetical protein